MQFKFNLLTNKLVLFFLFYAVTGCNNTSKKMNGGTNLFPAELVDFVPYEQNPVFKGTGADTWDNKIRERGYILKEDGIYKMWYTGYNMEID
jgi:hypothetical protein